MVRYKYYIGCSGYSYDEWVGPFYPKGLDKSKFLDYYVKFFNTVEINSTFYSLPTTKTVRRWLKVPKNFKYSIKFYREITHDKRLFLTKQTLDKFFDSVRPLLLDNKVDVFLIQLPNSIRKDLNRLEEFFNELPTDYRYAIEFRHESWLTNDTFDLLEKYNIAYVIVDEPLLPPIVKITTDFTYIRFHGHGKKVWYYYEYSEEELEKWVKKVKEEIAGNVDRLYIYFNNHFNGWAPKNARQFMRMLGLIF